MHQARVYDDLTFIDQGEYCEVVLCPSCGDHVAVNSLTGSDLGYRWDHDMLEDVAAGGPLRTFKTTISCCGASVPFTSLQFDMPAGFAASSSVSPARALTTRSIFRAAQLGELEAVLGCKLTQIEAGY